MAASALVVSCGGSQGADGLEKAGQVRGLVVDVVGRNIVELEVLRVRDEEGRTWEFTSGEGFIGFTPSHLREHQLAGQPVTVSYIPQGDSLLAVNIYD